MLTWDVHKKTNTIEIISIRKNKFTNERQKWGKQCLCFYYFCPATICFRLLVALNWWDISVIDTHLMMCVMSCPCVTKNRRRENNFSSILNDIFFSSIAFAIWTLQPLSSLTTSFHWRLSLSMRHTHDQQEDTHIHKCRFTYYILYRNAYTRNTLRNWSEESKWWWPLKNTHKQRTHQLTDRYLQIYLKIYTSLIITAIASLHLTNGSRKLILLLLVSWVWCYMISVCVCVCVSFLLLNCSIPSWGSRNAWEKPDANKTCYLAFC